MYDDLTTLQTLVHEQGRNRSHTHLLGCPPIAANDNETAITPPHERGHTFCAGWRFAMLPKAFYSALDIAFTEIIANKCFSTHRKHEVLNQSDFLQSCLMDVIDPSKPPFLPAPYSPGIEALPKGRGSKNTIGITKEEWRRLQNKHKIALELDTKIQRWTQGSNFAFHTGQVLYDTPKMYKSAWGEALKHLNCCIQVTKATPAQAGSKKRPRSPGAVEFDVYRPRAECSLEKVASHTYTQDEFVFFLLTGRRPKEGEL